MRPVAALRLFAREAVVPSAYLPSTSFPRFACSYSESHYPRRQTALKPLITVELLPAMLQSAPHNYPQPWLQIAACVFQHSAASLYHPTWQQCNFLYLWPPGAAFAHSRCIKKQSNATYMCVRTDTLLKIATLWRCWVLEKNNNKKNKWLHLFVIHGEVFCLGPERRCITMDALSLSYTSGRETPRRVVFL